MITQLVTFCLQRLLDVPDLMGIDGDNLDVEQLIIANMGDAD